ncbi:fusaric acid resistance protein [Caballeronia calidae]|uniref:Fusaric acid resistance protein n=1 Tax=Caballeronia calidae TaxID=1777139 RepID=A0A158AP55_9BURK|nr:FUSC family protein [Caballeronia calidae]SAK59440.1 fusaric acid resistance protein [Caballeronia calidae]
MRSLSADCMSFLEARVSMRDWRATDGHIWLHLAKTLLAAFLAMGIAMRLELPQPRVAMTTTFVLMQPFSGMVLAKSVYRFAGTALGMLAALVLGAVFVQQTELYVLALTLWVAACTALAVRYRQFRWYGFVLAGYTAALIGIPAVTDPNTLLIATLTRGAEVMLGIVCSSVVSALVFPRHASATLVQSLARRQTDFAAFAAGVLRGRLSRIARERRFADFVDEIVGFEATRGIAAYESHAMRQGNGALAQLNSAFMDACARLHALDQSVKRLRSDHTRCAHDALAPFLDELARILERDSLQAHLARYKATLPRRVREAQRSLASADHATQLDFTTSGELLYRFVDDTMRYLSIANGEPSNDRAPSRYEAKTNRFVIAATFARTGSVIAATAWFWIVTAWPSGGYAVIGATLACALSSASARPSKFIAQMAAGAACAVVTGYVFLCHVYPAIDGFALLCAVLAPPLAAGAFLAMRPAAAGYGIGFCVFFCLLAAPDNRIVYDPGLLLNNGVAVVVAMLAAAIACAVIVPPRTAWLVGKTLAELRAQAALACEGKLAGLGERFHSGTHDLMSQLRGLLTRRSREHRQALSWMLVTLEVGQAMIDLRREARALPAQRFADALRIAWSTSLARVLRDIAVLFRAPDSETLRRAIGSVVASILIAESMLDAVRDEPDERDARHDMQRVLACLHFIRTALVDPDAPFDAHR